MIVRENRAASISDAVSDAAASLLVPGAGQWIQGRRAVAIFHFSEVLAFAVAAGIDPTHRPVWLAFVIASAVWNVADAFWHRLRRGPRNDEGPA
jgi:hypothetical protein